MTTDHVTSGTNAAARMKPVTLNSHLPPRQCELGLLLAAGLDDEAVAHRMVIQFDTINSRKSELYSHFTLAPGYDRTRAVTIWFYINQAALLSYLKIVKEGKRTARDAWPETEKSLL